MNVGILGSGVVAKVLAEGFLANGHAVRLGTRHVAQLGEWVARHPGATVGSFQQAAAFGELLVLAVKGSAAADALRQAGDEHLRGKTVIDTTNPIADTQPVNGVLNYFTSLDRSLMEELQRSVPEANFVKAFSCVGNALMVKPQLEHGPPTMFICGNDEKAKATVRRVLDEFGWDTEDLGAAEAARAIEPLCILWCIPGFLRNDWAHALKMLR